MRNLSQKERIILMRGIGAGQRVSEIFAQIALEAWGGGLLEHHDCPETLESLMADLELAYKCLGYAVEEIKEHIDAPAEVVG